VNDRRGEASLCRDWRRETLTVIAVLAAVTCLFYYEVVFLGRTILPLETPAVMGSQAPYGFDGTLRRDLYRLDRGASTWQHEPWLRKVNDDYRAGRFPLWIDTQGFGAPLLGNPQTGGFDVFRLPLIMSGSALVWDFYYLARTFLGAVATYLFARYVGFATPARYFLAIAYIFSGHFFLLGNNLAVEAYFLLPVILLGTELLLGDHPRLGFALTAVAVALNLLIGMPEVSLAVFLLCAAYAAYHLLFRAPDLRTDGAWVTRTALLIGAWIIGFALAAPVLLPLVEFLAHGAVGTPRRETLGLNSVPLPYLASLYMPYLNGLPVYPIVSPPLYALQTYVGATVLALALYGLLPVRMPLSRRLAPFAALAVLLLLAKTVGMPGINELGRLPALKVTRFPIWFGPITGFCLALLASLAVHRLSTSPERPSRAVAALIAAIWVLLVALGVYANWDSVSLVPSGYVWFAVGVASLSAIGVWVITHFGPTRSPMLRGVACCVVLVGELFVLAPHGSYQDRYDRFVEPPFVAFLQERQAQSPFRVFGGEGMLYPNTASAYGLHDIRALDAIYVDRYMAYIKNFVSPQAEDRFVGDELTPLELDALLVNNPWFDLAGVRYVVAAPASMTAARLLGVTVDGVYAMGLQSGEKHQDIRVEPVTIGGVTKRALVEHAPDRLSYRIHIAPDGAALHFSLGMAPEVWEQGKTDGVAFEIEVETPGNIEQVYRRRITPTSTPDDQRWIDDSVDLSRFAGEDVGLTFVTRPLESADNDAAVWGDIRLTPEAGKSVSQYAMVYDDEVQLFENHRALPRAFLVQDVRLVDDVAGAIAAMSEERFDFRQTAVVESAPESQIATLGPDGGSIAIVTYNAQYVSIDVEAESPSFLVLTDSMYPGWTASVDGVETPIHATDVAFRGVFVPAGEHRIEFSYDPTSFRAGMAIAFLGLIALVVGSMGGAQPQWVSRLRTRHRDSPTA
jgi:hypothetical protein